MIRLAFHCCRCAIASLSLALFAQAVLAAPGEPDAASRAAGGIFSFAALGDVPYSPTEEASVRAMLTNIANGDSVFIVHDGNLKGEKEACSDALLSERIALLDSSVKPLIYIPGDNDWTDCGHPSAGDFNPVERLDFLRDRTFGQDTSLGQNTIPLLRQSDLARYRQYRENVRWYYQGVVFVGLNVPGSNNNYRTGAGRNGEYEDRVIANRVWLNHSLFYARQKKARGIVIIVQADPEFENSLPAAGMRGTLRRWFDVRRGSRDDGFAEFRRELAKLAIQFRRPVLLIHGSTDSRIDHPLRDSRGAIIPNFTRVATYGSPIANRWVRITVDPQCDGLFEISSQPALRRPNLRPASDADSR